MKDLNDGKDIYDNIKIPKELDTVVQDTIRKHPRKVRKFPVFKAAGYVAAAAVVCFTVVLNTNEAFAKEAGELPFIGNIAKVLTVRSYETHDDGKNITVNIPAVEVETETVRAEENEFDRLKAEEFSGDINAEIQKLMDDYVTDAEKRFEEYKQAFFETGGTEEEWAGREIDIQADYDVKYQQGSLLSLVVSTSEGWYAAYSENHYYNLDLESNRRLTLKDVLGEKYQEIADAAIKNEMQKRMQEDENLVYWGMTGNEEDDMVEGFTGVGEDADFYINEAGNPVVCFAKYDVAPGFMGIQEFEVK